AVVSQILDAIGSLSAIHEYLPTHYWLAFGDLLRDPISTEQVSLGLLSATAYALIFWSAAWARFGGKDVTS
ncbi:MAG: ABC transporter permease, partial [Marmoricola sp.]